jgi:hypothetical protein
MFSIRRREFITLLGGATAWPLAARAPRWRRPFAFLTAELRFREVACWD